MAPFAVNLLSLIIVIGLSWAAVMWLSGRFHGQSRDLRADLSDEADDLRSRVEQGYSVPTQQTRDPHVQLGGPADCTSCEGVGARHDRGRIQPCEHCGGTGVLVLPGSAES